MIKIHIKSDVYTYLDVPELRKLQKAVNELVEKEDAKSKEQKSSAKKLGIPAQRPYSPIIQAA